jgi:Calx-beta domain
VGGRATITVLRSAPTGGTVSVQYATSDGTARAGVDYVAASGALTFAPGVTQRTFTVKLIANRVGNRTVNLTLSNPGGGALLGTPTSAVLTILPK